jgi:2-isopropylmalate synthase
MQKNKMAFQRYCQYPTVFLPDRTWPDKTITQAPIWCSIDLRDGNQALSIPMNVEEKIRMFELLVSIGFKEIEVGFPSASEVEYQFVRRLIEEQRIPDDVIIQVLTQARENLIKRTFDSLRGVKQAIVHVYNSTSTVQRNVVFRMNKQEVKNIAVKAAELCQALRAEQDNPGICFEYTPESFPGTELDYALEVCSAVIDVWAPYEDKKIIINLPTTVEMSTPNVYADRIEWFCRNIKRRDSVIISVHTHNDRGTAVASAELAVMAGAQRVEGALFGNGERSGNMDIITMALNLFSQGVNPKLDFSQINKIEEVYRKCTRMDVHPRHPYAGELVYTAFSGSHQDAINKGMKAQKNRENNIWDVPYLPIDPKDVGRTYEAIIRINSQSGKGGIAYIMETDWGFKIPKEMQPEFARIIQAKTEITARELSSPEIKHCFEQEYISHPGRFQLESCVIHSDNDASRETSICCMIKEGQQEISIKTKGNGPVDAFVRGIQKHFNISMDIAHYSEHALTQGANAQAIAYIGINTENKQIVFGAGIDQNISIASLKAILNAVNRR